MGPVLDAFGRHRLVTFDRDAVTRGPTVEIAHEALLTEWVRLRRWIEAARIDIRAERQLAAAMDEWQASEQDSDFLLTGARLARYEGWSTEPPVPITAGEHEFLAVSEAADAAELETERRRVRRLRRLVAGVGLALVLALIAGGLALQQQRRADDEARRAEDEAQRATDEAARAEASAADAVAQTEAAVLAAEEAQLATLISRSAAAITGDPELAVLLALEAVERAPGPDTERALLNALTGSTIVSRVVSRQSLDDDCLPRGYFPPQLQGMAELATVDGRMVSREPVTGEITDHGRSLADIRGESGAPPGECTIGYSDGSFGGAASSFGRLWAGPDFGVELDLAGPAFPFHFGAERVVATRTDAPVALLYDARTGEQIGSYEVEGRDAIIAAAYSEDLELVAFSFVRNPEETGTLVVVDSTTGEEVFRRPLNRAPGVLRFGEVTGNLILGIGEGQVVTVDPFTGVPATEVETGLVTGFVDIGVRADGTLVLVGRDRIQLADRATGPFGPAYEITNVGSAFVRPDGLVVTVDDQGQIDVFDLDGGSLLVDERWDTDPFGHVSIVDGRAVELSRSGDLIETIDLATGDRTRLDLRMSGGEVFRTTQVYAEPDGAWAISDELILARWEDGVMVESLDMGSSEEVVWVPYGRKPVGARFGDLYAVLGERADGSREASLVGLTRGSPEVRFTVPTEARWVHPSADGGLYAIDPSGAVVTHDAAGQIAGVAVTGASDPNHATLDPTGRWLAIAGLERGEVRVLDTQTGDVTLMPGRLGIASVMGFSGDGSLLGLAMFDGTVVLYDVEANSVPVEVWSGSGAFDSEPGWYDAETQSLWLNSSGKLLRISLDPAQWAQRACEVVGRALTDDEWDRFVPGDEPRRSVCENP